METTAYWFSILPELAAQLEAKGCCGWSRATAAQLGTAAVLARERDGYVVATAGRQNGRTAATTCITYSRSALLATCVNQRPLPGGNRLENLVTLCTPAIERWRSI